MMSKETNVQVRQEGKVEAGLQASTAAEDEVILHPGPHDVRTAISWLNDSRFLLANAFLLNSPTSFLVPYSLGPHGTWSTKH